MWAAKTVKRPPQQPAHPQYANYWAPLTRKRHTMPHPAQPQRTNYWAARTRKRHQQEHRPQRPTERSDPTQHAKGRTGDCPGPRKETTTRRNVTQGGMLLKGFIQEALQPDQEFLEDLMHKLQQHLYYACGYNFDPSAQPKLEDTTSDLVYTYARRCGRPMGAAAYGGRGFKGRARICDERPIGAASGRQQHNQAS